MGWLRRILLADIMEREIIVQRETIRLLRLELGQTRLEHLRHTYGLIEQFLVAQEDGRDVREPLLAGMRDLDDHIARMEEHIL